MQMVLPNSRAATSSSKPWYSYEQLDPYNPLFAALQLDLFELEPDK